MAFSPYSTPVNPPKFQEPLDLNLYAKGLMYKEGQAKENLQLIGNSLSTLNSIPAYGVDAEILQNKLANVKSQIAQMNVSNLGDINTMSQLNSIISQTANDPDILAIARRGNSYAQELKAKREAEEKGRNYISPLLDEANEYYNSGTFIRDKQFNKYGFIAPDLIKYQEAAQKMTPTTKKWQLLPNGERMQVESQSKEDLKNTYYNLIAQDPNGQKYLDYSFNKSYGNVDWNTYGKEELGNNINKLYNDILDIQRTGGDPSAHIAEYNKLNNLYNSSSIGNAMKDRAYKSWVNSFVEDWADAVDYVSEGDRRLGELDKMKIQHAYDIAEKTYQAQLDAGLVKGIPAKASDIDKKVYEAAIASGKPIYDNSGNLIPAKDLASQQGLSYNPQESRDAITTTNGNQIKVPTKIKNLISTLETGTSLNSQETEDLASLVDNNREKLGIDPNFELPNIKVVGDNIEVEVDDWGTNTTIKIPKSDFIDKILKQDNQTTVNTDNTSKINIATPSNFVHKAQYGNDTIYSLDGNNWYNTKGTKIE